MNDKSQLVGRFVSVPTSPEQLWRWRSSSKPLLSSQKINKGQVEVARTKSCHNMSWLIWTSVSSVVGGIKVGKGVGGLIAQCIKATDW